MQAWLRDNKNPYPTLAQRREIASAAGVTEKVVTFWFGNVRQRAWKVCVCVCVCAWWVLGAHIDAPQSEWGPKRRVGRPSNSVSL